MMSGRGSVGRGRPIKENAEGVSPRAEGLDGAEEDIGKGQK